MRVASGNVQWATGTGVRADAVRRAIQGAEADVFVATELGDRALLPIAGYVVDAGDDWGYGRKRERRKVAMWSRAPWQHVDTFVEFALPPGRCVGGSTTTSIGPVFVLGVCIPWSGAHVANGHRVRRRWEEHRIFLNGLRALLQDRLREQPIILCGDFNQVIPRRRQPKDCAALLAATLGELTLATAREFAPAGFDRLIDHVAVSAAFEIIGSEAWNAGAMSDHDGVVVDLRCKRDRQPTATPAAASSSRNSSAR